MKGFLRELAITLGLALIIFLAYHAVAQTSVVDGSSMLPGLQNGQRLIVSKAAYFFSSPQRGDVIILHPPVDPGERIRQVSHRLAGGHHRGQEQPRLRERGSLKRALY